MDNSVIDVEIREENTAQVLRVFIEDFNQVPTVLFIVKITIQKIILIILILKKLVYWAKMKVHQLNNTYQ